MSEKFSLSVEELILAMYVLGERDAAASLAGMTFGQVSEEELEIRLLTAGHSLAARDWLTVDAVAEKNELYGELRDAVRPVADASFSLRLSKQEQGEEKALGIHVYEDLITAHVVEQGVIHRLKKLEDFDNVWQAVVDFFPLQMSDETVVAESPLNVKELQAAAKQEIADLQVSLEEVGIEVPQSRWLAEDLQSGQAFASLLRIDYTEDREPFSDQGLLLLIGEGRFWLLRKIAGGENEEVSIELGTRDALVRELQQLLRGESHEFVME